MIMPRISPLLKRIYPKALEIDSHRIGLGKTRACAPPKPLQCPSNASPKPLPNLLEGQRPMSCECPSEGGTSLV